ncbi:sulfate transporter [Thalassobaculum fulvum]|uniref:Sulfate transporter n=1 Tax=Thalassobaculum fulvum TaxID=1633335 RepID=A0A918XPL6_9PROT|nr:putative sulfate/molybdate transporter [Thalassobaculum fulvum]GHD42664.1 sulfate transporter [Thalassobaculum fulvum]
MDRSTGNRFTLDLCEVGGALGDLGTLLPLMLGVIAVAGLAPTPVLLGFAAFYVATALVYRLPIPVQPMKAVAAVLLTTQVSGAGLVAAGVTIGAVMLLLGVTGWIDRVARAVPQSVLAGLQLGLGLALALVAVELLGTAPVAGAVILGLLLALLLVPRYPAALIALLAAVLLAQAVEIPGVGFSGDPAAGFALPALPTLAELRQSVTQLVLPQLSLTLTNAVLITALLAGDYYGSRATHVTPARLSVTTGLANLLLAPFGALPMCHGAGGLAAHHRFGARSGTAPLLLGLALAALALAPGRLGIELLAAVPAAGLGALLLVAAGELALSRRLFDGKPSCLPVIAATAAVTLWADPFWGLLAGCGAELVRVAVVRRLLRRDARSR